MATTHQETATKLPWANIGLMADPLGVITRKLTSFSTFAGLYAMLTVDEQESFEEFVRDCVEARMGSRGNGKRG